jgi:hypothetical protein
VPSANRSTIAKARPTGHGQPNGDAAYAHGSNVARPEAGVGVQESLLAGLRELENNLAREKSTVSMVWEGYRSRLCKCNNFNENGLFGTDNKFDRFLHIPMRLLPIVNRLESPWQNGVAERWVGSCRRSPGSHHRSCQAGDCHRLASQGVSTVLELEESPS